MNTVQRFKQKRIIKAQLGTLLKKGWNWFKDSNQVAAIAESPAVMTASGWRVDKNNKVKQDQQNTKEVKQLRNNLATIGEAGIAAPTMVGDVEGLYNVVRHPVQTYNTIKSTISNGIKTGEQVIQNFKNRNSDKSVLSGLRASITDWDYSEPEKIKWTSQQLKTLFNKRKVDVMNYVNGDEFKQRVMNTGQFTENDYKNLIKEIEYIVNKKTHYAGKKTAEGGANTYLLTENKANYDSYVTLHDNHSLTQQTANVWHELWHSIGGRKQYRNKKQFPQLYKLQDYNNNLNVNKSQRLMEYEKDTGDNWYNDNILKRNREIRSRASVFLDFLRKNGYDTKILLKNPDKLNEYLNEIKSKRIQVPWDIRQLIQSVDYSSLKKYLSKVLGASSGVYVLNNNLNN